MALQKKHGKGRLDKWYKLAKEKGYRARAAFKLIQLNKKYGFLEQSKVLLDLCAAPGSWSQVAAETMPSGSLIVGVDLAPIKPISKVITFQSDITTEKCRATIRQYLKSYKADTVLHDGAPNVGTSWVQDSFNQAELVLQSLKLATEFLIEGGTFVTKVFRSKDYNPLLWVFNQLFSKVEATKPPSSRNVSAEIFVVCKGFKAPKRIDPRFLDPRTVFAELAAPAPNNEAKVYRPEIKKRKREGYDEGDYTQYKEILASEFIHSDDPISILAKYNRLTFTQPANGDMAIVALNKLPETTDEIRSSCDDLKVLGRKEFKMLLKWRLRVRELFGLATKPTASPRPLSEKVAEEVAEVESMDEELQLQKDLQELKAKEDTKKKRERRKENEQKQKEIVRRQLNMTTTVRIVTDEFSHMGEGSMFALKQADKHSGSLTKLARGKMAMITETGAKKELDSGIGSSGVTDDESDKDEDGDRLEEDLDAMYENYRERKAESDAKYRAKRAREEHEGGWEGLSGEDKAESDDSYDVEEDSSDDSGDETEERLPRRALTDFDGEPEEDGGLSRKAKGFFNQDDFKGIPGLDGDSEETVIETPQGEGPELAGRRRRPGTPASPKPAAAVMVSAPDTGRLDDRQKSGQSGVGGSSNAEDDESDWEDKPQKREDGKLDIEVVTAEAMTLAHQLAMGEKTRHNVVDDGFNKHAFRDRDGLPEWFLDDEGKHDKLHKPITKTAADAIKEKLRALNARPIKKVREAKARKKYKMAKKLEKLRKKSDMLASDEGMTEKEKADSIAKMISKASKQKPRQPAKLVVASGVNKGIQGRPRGVPKGRRYKLVDSRMKKELRAQKRIAKKKK